MWQRERAIGERERERERKRERVGVGVGVKTHLKVTILEACILDHFELHICSLAVIH
jgi:hypothetical protein